MDSYLRRFCEVGFLPKQKNKSYSKDMKEDAVKEYLAGKGSFIDIARKHEICSPSVLERWVSKYNGYEKLKDYNPKGEVYMTKRRKTTVEERQEIVAYCLEHDSEIIQNMSRVGRCIDNGPIEGFWVLSRLKCII